MRQAALFQLDLDTLWHDRFGEPLEAREQRVRTKLNELLTVDLLGPLWRRRELPTDYTSDSETTDRTNARLELLDDFLDLSERAGLASREQEILRASIEGLTRREIAEKLGISQGRVGSAQDRIRKKVKKTRGA